MLKVRPHPIFGGFVRSHATMTLRAAFDSVWMQPESIVYGHGSPFAAHHNFAGF